jgi:hypothetical protein
MLSYFCKPPQGKVYHKLVVPFNCFLNYFAIRLRALFKIKAYPRNNIIAYCYGLEVRKHRHYVNEKHKSQ